VESGLPLNDWKVKPLGRQKTLTEAQELLAVRRISHLAHTTSGVTLHMVRAKLVVVAAMRLPGEKDDKAAVARVKRCGSKDHLRSLRKRHGISVSRVGRPMEKERAMAQQPELRVNYYRLILRALTLGACPSTFPRAEGTRNGGGSAHSTQAQASPLPTAAEWTRGVRW
jgi:hypothetical protein